MAIGVNFPKFWASLQLQLFESIDKYINLAADALKASWVIEKQEASWVIEKQELKKSTNIIGSIPKV